MRLLLSNFRTECEPRQVDVPGNPLLTYGELRAGDGVPNTRGGDGRPIAEWINHLDLWVLIEDGSGWTDIEILSAASERLQVSV